MSEIPKIKSSSSVSIPKISSVSINGPISNEYYEKNSQINNFVEQVEQSQIENLYTSPFSMPESSITQINKPDFSALDRKVVNYNLQKKKELDEYRKILEPVEKEIKDLEFNLADINEAKSNYEIYKQDCEGRISEIVQNYFTFCSDAKLAELGITSSELADMDYGKLLELCNEKDSAVLEINQNLKQYQTDYLDKKIEALTGYKTYEEYKQYLDNLKSDQSVLLSAIRLTKEDMNTARYRFLLEEEDYQNYSYEMVKIGTQAYAKASPLEKVRASGTLGYTIENEDYEALTNLLKASESNPDLAKMYNYIYEKEGIDSANVYLVKMESSINQVCGMQQAQKFLDKLKTEENVVDTINNHLKTTGKGLITGVETFSQGISSWFTSSDAYSINDYETMYILQELQTNENYNGLLDNNFEISESIGNMLPSIALSMLLTPAVGTTSMGISAGGNSYHSALAEGYSTEKAAVYGVINGVSEATLERYLGAIPGLSNVSVTGLKTFAQAMAREGIEEGTQEYLDAFVRSGLFKEEFDLEEVSKNAEKSAIYGAITGGILNTPSLAINEINNYIESNQNMNQGTIQLPDLEYSKHSETIEILNPDSYVLSTEGLDGQIKEIVEDWNSMGTVEMEIGTKLESIFKSKDTLSGIHMTSNLTSANQILNEGLQLTGHSSSGVNSSIDLDLNVSFTKQDDFLAIPKFFRNIKSASFYKNYAGTGIGYAMVVQIPSNITDISALTYQKNGITYLKPEFIKAQIEVNNGNVSDSKNTFFKSEKNNGLSENFKNNFFNKLLFSNNPEFSQLGDNTQAVEKLYATFNTVYEKGDAISKNIVTAFLGTKKIIQIFPSETETSAYMNAFGVLQLNPNIDNNVLLHELGHYYFHQLLDKVPENFGDILDNAKNHAMQLKNVDFEFNGKKFENAKYLNLLEEICKVENKKNQDLGTVSDIISGVHLGAPLTGPNGPLVLPFMHSSQYYTKRGMEVKLENIDYAKVFDEQFANFFSLYMNNQIEKIEVLKLFLGEEWYNAMMDTLNEINNICININGKNNETVEVLEVENIKSNL